MIIAIAISVLIIMILIELIITWICGNFIKEEIVTKYLDEKEDEFRINFFSDSIIIHQTPNDATFITDHTGLSFFSEYYVYGIGRVYRWSEGHRRIEKLFEELKNKNT
jgi:hypothetical protein